MVDNRTRSTTKTQSVAISGSPRTFGDFMLHVARRRAQQAAPLRKKRRRQVQTHIPHHERRVRDDTIRFCALVRELVTEELLELFYFGLGLLHVGLGAVWILRVEGLLGFGDVIVHAGFGGDHISAEAQSLRGH